MPSNKLKNFDQFCKVPFSTISPFKRSEYGFIHNLIKFMAMMISFVLYKLVCSANLLDLSSIFNLEIKS